MKNIMNTTLVAVAIAIASVGNVDARRLERTGSDASTILNSAKDAVQTGNKQDLADVIDPAGKSADEQAIIRLRAKEKMIMDKIALEKQEMSALNYGWFGLGTSKEKQDAYRDAKANITQLTADLKQVQADIKKSEMVVGKGYSNAVKYAIGAAAVLGIALAVDQYMYEGKGRAAAMAAGQRGLAAGKRGATATGKYASEKYTAGKEAVTSRYNRMRGTAPVATPAYNLPEYN